MRAVNVFSNNEVIVEMFALSDEYLYNIYITHNHKIFLRGLLHVGYFDSQMQ